MNPGSKYFPLYEHLRASKQDKVTLALNIIESLIGERLPASARTRRAWWSNRRSGAVQADAWMEAGYHAEEIDLENERVTFRKPGIVYNVQRDGNTLVWNAELIKALRYHMGMTQAEFAQELNVRQPTISEWERGAYEPRGASTKVLTLVAEQAGFRYE